MKGWPLKYIFYFLLIYELNLLKKLKNNKKLFANNSRSSFCFIAVAYFDVAIEFEINILISEIAVFARGLYGRKI